MKDSRLFAAFLGIAIAVFAWAGEGRAEPHRLGVGANYWVTVDDIDADDIDDDGFSYLASYQYWPSLVGMELSVELLPDRFGEDAYAPQAYVLVGSGLYAGAGIGIVNTDGDFADDPFYAFKAGLQFELLPSLYLDLAAHYRFESSEDLEDEDTEIDSDTVFLGAAVRLGF
jgi:hypothetical protein